MWNKCHLDELFVQKLDDVKFRISGLSTSLPFTFTGLGTGTHVLKVQDPNKQTIILIDNIIQTPIKNKKTGCGCRHDS